ncbi:rRNA maturation RNase YbeY [Lactobacillus sp. S2-2]|uniref:rRNA maturation RNase YbeY n=1 Tax=Lactobacillus sp. S2-2 TaxID=2692917 RepID=UPI001F014AAB|nr:rRNA maturation RNase YbeY [Lactobacillus sp. S2-2]MCF6514984.1 rRNA maturation RNase YbeY [Lactobacillus sp. S2-2]
MDLEIYDHTKNKVSDDNIELIESILNFSAKKIDLNDNTEMSVTLVNNDEIQDINREYRNVDRATDVISFAIEDNEDDFPILMTEEMQNEIPKNIGDIFISVDKVKEQADFLNHSYERELAFLALHGFLHLNGYDHMEPEDEKIMMPMQRVIMEEYGLER